MVCVLFNSLFVGRLDAEVVAALTAVVLAVIGSVCYFTVMAAVFAVSVVLAVLEVSVVSVVLVVILVCDGASRRPPLFRLLRTVASGWWRWRCCWCQG